MKTTQSVCLSVKYIYFNKHFSTYTKHRNMSYLQAIKVSSSLQLVFQCSWSCSKWCFHYIFVALQPYLFQKNLNSAKFLVSSSSQYNFETTIQILRVVHLNYITNDFKSLEQDISTSRMDKYNVQILSNPCSSLWICGTGHLALTRVHKLQDAHCI